MTYLIPAALNLADSCSIPVKLASKKRSRTRSKSRSRSKAAQKAPVFANFVIPLAGILSSVTARFYDMGVQSQKSREQSETEHTPLLSESGRHDSSTNAKKGARWIICNALIILISLLIFVTTIVLCVFFGCKRPILDLPHAIADFAAYTDLRQPSEPESLIHHGRVFA